MWCISNTYGFDKVSFVYKFATRTKKKLANVMSQEEYVTRMGRKKMEGNWYHLCLYQATERKEVTLQLTGLMRKTAQENRLVDSGVTIATSFVNEKLHDRFMCPIIRANLHVSVYMHFCIPFWWILEKLRTTSCSWNHPR